MPKQNKAQELAEAISQKMKISDTPADLFAIGSSLTSNSGLIDKAITIIEEGEKNESKSGRRDQKTK